MKVNVREFLEEAGVEEPFYPGKRLVHHCRQIGEYKNHCVVLDWRNPDKIRIEIKAGMSGRDLEPQKLKYYPVCFQSPTYVNIEVINDNEQEEDDDDKSSKGRGSTGKGGGGGKKPAKKSLKDVKLMASNAFGSVMEGKVPELGKIVEMVVMGTKIATEAYGNVMKKLAQQIQHAKISATDLLAQGGKFITKYTPPAFMEPTGNEDVKYEYDQEKNADIGFRSGLG